MRTRKIFVSLAITAFSYGAINGQDNSVTVEAESGLLGSGFKTIDTLGVKCVTIKTNTANYYPGANRVNTYEVNFPSAGTYDIYARILVGKNTFNDDSYFISNGFDIKNDSSASDWIMANGLAAGGYTLNSSVVDGIGGAQSLVWKWLNISKFIGSASADTFVVTNDALTQTFQIGAREDGLYFDKFVFGKRGYYFTVFNLNNGQSGSSTPPSELHIGTPLAAGKSKFLGCGFDNIQKPQFQGYWNQVTPGNAGKWGSVEGTRGVWNWTDLDSATIFAKRYGFSFKEHTLIWGAQQPSWISELDSATQRMEIEKWFSMLAARYDSIPQIDVVNEPLHNLPDGSVSGSTKNANYIKALGGTGATGYDWVITAFKLARQYFPKSKLILNDYSIINNSKTTQTYKKLIVLLQAQNLIDGIGEQAHAFTTSSASSATLKANLDTLATTGLPIYITEMDVDGLTDISQLLEFERVFPIFWEHPAIKGITLWGYRFGVWRNAQGAYLVNESGEERLALKWLKAYVNDTLTKATSIAITDSIGKLQITKKGDSTRMIAKFLPVNTTLPHVTWSVSPAGIAKINENGLLTAIANGKVTVTASAVDGSGVKSTATITITNNATNVTDKSLIENVEIYPNPVLHGNLKVRNIENIITIEMLDLTGRKVLEINNTGKTSIDIHVEKKGVYVLRFFNGQNYNYKKIVVE